MKRIIYHCFGGTHSSVMAAALHTGILNDEKVPTGKELLECPYFDKIEQGYWGRLFFIGRDNRGSEVYVMGCRGAGSLVETALKEFARITGVSEEDFLLVDTIPCLNMLMKTGGFLSRRLGLKRLGRLLLIPGSRLAFPKLKTLVHNIRETAPFFEEMKKEGKP